ncbi:glycosyltransferase WbsX family protein [Edwardsiella tarda]|uniref:glycosyltransferase WbsX family protein n=1 Tax=Edwardsiella tarda TaxID=636 RepID=UPI003F654B5C
MQVKEVFAYYLPQFHEIKENNEWWGEGFTEWVNVKNAKKIYRDQEILTPGELGYYNLSDVSVIEKQYSLAAKHGISSFCFWHYWFGDDDLLLEKPAEKIINSDLSVRFCFAWANHSWWNKSKNILLKEQKYDFSIEKYFNYLLKFFNDERYTKIENKPVFVIYKPLDIPNLDIFKRKFDQYAINHGFNGIFWIAENSNSDIAAKYNFDYYLNSAPFLKYRSLLRKVIDRIIIKLSQHNIRIPRRYDYKKCIESINSHVKDNKEIPLVFPRWDSTIRHGKGGMYVHKSTPELFEYHLSICQKILKDRELKDRILFVKSWNEWAEGNFIEPDNVYGDEYLRAFSKYFEIHNV